MASATQMPLVISPPLPAKSWAQEKSITASTETNIKKALQIINNRPLPNVAGGNGGVGRVQNAGFVANNHIKPQKEFHGLLCLIGSNGGA
jgi:hypothetical protein